MLLVLLLKQKLRLGPNRKKVFPWIISIFFLFLLFKIPNDFKFFKGLEYEDSYLANSVSRFLIYNQRNLEFTFSATTCGIGSLSECEISSIYPSNLIGLPSVLYLVHKIVGYNHINVSFLNLFFAFISLIGIYIFCYKCQNSHEFALISSFVFITTPVFNSFHSSALFETSVSGLIMISLILFVMYFEEKGRSRTILLFSSLIVLFVLLIHFKREGIIIILFPLIYVFGGLIRNRDKGGILTQEFGYFLIFCVALGVYYFNVFEIGLGLEMEREYAMGNPFQFKFFIPLVSMFLKGFSNFDWFFIYAPLALIGTFYILIEFKKRPYLSYPLLILVALIFINTLHHRSYYFVRNDVVTSFESLRHINLLSPFFSILAGYGIYKSVIYCKTRFKKKLVTIGLYSLGILLLPFLFNLSYESRHDLINIETQTRITPIKELIKITQSKDAIVITDQSVLLQNYCSEKLPIIDFAMMGSYLVTADIKKLINQKEVYLLWEDYFEESIFRGRYNRSIKILEELDMITIKRGKGYAIKKLVNHTL